MSTATTRTIRLAISTLAALVVVTVGCGDFNEVETPDDCSAEAGTCEAEVFVSARELEFLRQEADPIILDARPNEQDFVDGHIPGANFAAWGEHRNDENKLLEDDDKLQEVVQSMGVTADRPVLIYGAGDGSGGDSVAGNLYWALEYLGHDDVYIVDGGLDAWLDADYAALATGSPDAEQSDFQIERNPEIHADFEELKGAIDDEESVIIDTRRRSEWLGDEQRGNPQGGHVPDAVHYHWENIFEEDGTLRPADELKAELQEEGIEPGLKALPYCQSGVRSGYFYAVLKWLDYDDAVNYDGSWWEWSRQADGEFVIVPEDDQEDETE